MIFVPSSQFSCFGAHLSKCLNSVLNVKALVGEVLVGAFSIIVKSSRRFVASSEHKTFTWKRSCGGSLFLGATLALRRRVIALLEDQVAGPDPERDTFVTYS